MIRRSVQTICFLITGQWLVIGFLRCPFGVPFVSCANCPLGDCSGQWLHLPVWLALLGTAVLFGRAFCGWICPLGFVQDIEAHAAPRLPALKPPARTDRAMRWVKVGVLVLTVWFIWHLNLVDERPHPYVVRSTSMWNWESYRIAWELGLKRYPVRAALLATGLLGALLIPRFWCRYLCPLGAVLGLANRCSIYRIRRNRELCSDCGKYPRLCVQHSTPESGECIICGDCIGGCPTKALSLERRYPAAQTTDEKS